jgi:protein SCO1/2
MAAVYALAGCGGSSSAGAHTTAVRYDAPGRISPAKPAPPTSLMNYDGQRVTFASLRGRAVVVTFVYSHCPDTCPLIVRKLRTAQALLGSARSRLQIVAISTDPAQDTPGAVRRFLRRRGMLGRMDYLLGSPSMLHKAWAAWGVGAKRISAKPEDVEHSALIYGVTGSGRVTTLYPPSFKPQWIAHDVPLLASH